MIKIEDLKVGDILIGKITKREYKIVYISDNDNIFTECGNIPNVCSKERINNYTLKPRQTKVYIVIWRYDNKINVDKIYNESYLNEINNNCDVLDVLEYYEDI